MVWLKTRSQRQIENDTTGFVETFKSVVELVREEFKRASNLFNVWIQLLKLSVFKIVFFTRTKFIGFNINIA